MCKAIEAAFKRKKKKYSWRKALRKKIIFLQFRSIPYSLRVIHKKRHVCCGLMNLENCANYGDYESQSMMNPLD